MQLFTLGGSKIEVFEAYSHDIVTTQNDHPRYVKPVLGRIHPIWESGRGGGGGSKGLVHNLLMQLFTLDSSKIEVFETCLFNVLIT